MDRDRGESEQAVVLEVLLRSPGIGQKTSIYSVRYCATYLEVAEVP